MDDNQILELRKKLKEIESKLKVKPKTITISGEAHNIIKNYCDEISISIGEWAEKKLISATKNNKVFLIDSPTMEIGNRIYSCIDINVRNLEDFFRLPSLKDKDIYIYNKEIIYNSIYKYKISFIAI